MRRLMVGLLAAVAAAAGNVPQTARAQTLTVREAATSRVLDVATNRAVVLESEAPFAEVSVANPEIADISTLSERAVYVLGQTPGRTTLTLLGPGGQLISNVAVQVTPDVSELKELLRTVLPREPIEVRTANDGLVLSGTVSSSTAVDRAVSLAQRYAPDRVSNLMSVGGSQQVMLKVRFAEMNRSISKELGASFGLATQADDGDVTIGAESGTFAGDGLVGDDAGASGVTGLAGSTAGAFSLGVDIGDVQLGVLLEALESKGFVRTLAEPNLTALSGQQAEFLAGGEFPVPVAGEDGQVTVEFKPFGVQLAFTPRVVDGNINLQLTAEVSGVDPDTVVTGGGLAINGFNTRSTSSTVELEDGESFAIAGLLQDDFTSLSNRVPWLGDVPVLGALFRSSEYQRDQSELVILITAHLVAPVRGEPLELPTDRVRAPTERELFLEGEVSAPVTGAAGEVARQDFSGSYGYVME